MFGFFPLDALVYLLLAAIAAYIAVKVAKSKGATKRGKIVTGAIAFFVVWLIPFWDWLPTVIYHNYLCRTEAGVKIYRSVEGVEGFLADGAWPLNLGYEYVDVSATSSVVRYRRNPDKSSSKPWIEEAVRKPSLYGFKSQRFRLKWNALELRYTTYVVSSDEVLATFIDFATTAADPNVSMSEWRKPWLANSSCFSDSNSHLMRKNQMIVQSLQLLKLNN
jgi:hypothetical protein